MRTSSKIFREFTRISFVLYIYINYFANSVRISHKYYTDILRYTRNYRSEYRSKRKKERKKIFPSPIFFTELFRINPSIKRLNNPRILFQCSERGVRKIRLETCVPIKRRGKLEVERRRKFEDAATKLLLLLLLLVLAHFIDFTNEFVYPTASQLSLIVESSVDGK